MCLHWFAKSYDFQERKRFTASRSSAARENRHVLSPLLFPWYDELGSFVSIGSSSPEVHRKSSKDVTCLWVITYQPRLHVYFQCLFSPTDFRILFWFHTDTSCREGDSTVSWKWSIKGREWWCNRKYSRWRRERTWLHQHGQLDLCLWPFNLVQIEALWEMPQSES